MGITQHKLVKASNEGKSLQLKGKRGDLKDDVYHCENYGFAAYPSIDMSKTYTFSLNNGDDLFAIALNQKHRPSLSEKEVAMGNFEDKNFAVFKNDGTIEINKEGVKKLDIKTVGEGIVVNVVDPGNITINVANGNVDLTAGGDINATCENATLTTNANATVNATGNIVASCVTADVDCTNLDVDCTGTANINASGTATVDGSAVNLGSAIANVLNTNANMNVIVTGGSSAGTYPVNINSPGQTKVKA